VIGTCAWCERPAVETIEVEPAQQRMVTQRSEFTGELITAPVTTRFAVYANVCPAHLTVRDREGGKPIRDLRRTQAVDVLQLDIFGNEVVVGARGRPKASPRSAIGGE
jgi:hypothetical protein